MIPIVISGGSGTRLWPLSRASLPKQFCRIFNESLQTKTLKRLARLGTPWIVTSEKLRTLSEHSVREAGLQGVTSLYEPFGRNTAPAVALICRRLEMEHRLDEIVGLFPADHLIENTEAFLAAIEAAQKRAIAGAVVTLGLKPTHPATGYGYIHVDRAARVLNFHEKPSLSKAESYLQAGDYLWNAGIFIFKVQTMIDLFKKHQPQMWQKFAKLQMDMTSLSEIYKETEPISIDYAIIEKMNGGLDCIACDFGWSDIGSWDAVAHLNPENKNAQVFQNHSQNNFVQAQPNKIYGLVNVDDLIVVDTPDALLISRRGSSEQVKETFAEIKKANEKVVNEHLYEERPWGRFEVMRDRQYFKSKVIEVDPGQQISYQSHEKREEHWVIVRGQGEITLNEKTILVQPGSYVKIPTHARHRIRNVGHELLQFIEVQISNHCREDDIVRYQDDYNRA
jgi:mannose-1-phosphate guanylyltransferase/mannose-1-phosphate guanylyltransferase/mannose-6-phosphate isomerase